MKANGYGRVEQTIVITVPQSDADTVAKKLDAHILPATPVSTSCALVWKRSTIKRGDDDDIVWHLNVALGGLPESIEWNIDWRASIY